MQLQLTHNILTNILNQVQQAKLVKLQGDFVSEISPSPGPETVKKNTFVGHSGTCHGCVSQKNLITDKTNVS